MSSVLASFTDWVDFNKIVLMIIVSIRNIALLACITLAMLSVTAIPACTNTGSTPLSTRKVPYEAEWGIYTLNLANQEVKLIYSSPDEIQTSALRLNNTGDKLVFAQKVGDENNTGLEIFSIGTNGLNLQRLTRNSFWDLYPVWSPDGERVAFLSWREKDLDIYVMDADGANERKIFDSGFHDADIDWVNDIIVFTSEFAVWRINTDGTQPVRVTDPPGRGEWGKANLPKGDYDPRLSRDGNRIVFERLEDTTQPHGGYDLFLIGTDGTGETRLTDNTCSQGLASWSNSGEEIVYTIAAVGETGKYDMYTVLADGTGNQNITPEYFPPDFLCHSPIFFKDDSGIFFIGQWWQ